MSNPTLALSSSCEALTSRCGGGFDDTEEGSNDRAMLRTQALAIARFALIVGSLLMLGYAQRCMWIDTEFITHDSAVSAG